MKKVIQKSLVASIALASFSTYSLGADTISDAFANGKIKGALKSYYFDEDYDSATSKDNNIWANGIKLSYKTDTYKGISLGSTFQSSTVTSDNGDISQQAKYMDASGSVLSEAYLEYKYANTTFKGGRQFVSLPLIKGSGSRLIEESFEGYFLNNTDIPDTLISLGKVNQYQTRTDKVDSGVNAATFSSTTTDGNVGEFNKIGTDGAISLYVKNNSIKNLTVQAHYVDFIDEVKDLYVDATYKFGGDFKPFIAAQYYNSDYDLATTPDSSFTGYKIGATFFDVNLHASYTSTDDKGSVIRGIGEAATASFTSSTSTVGNYTGGTDSWQVGASKKFGNLSTKVTYTNSDAVLTENDLTQKYLELKYNFSGALKNLALSGDYTIYDYGFGNDKKDKNELRVKLVYSF